MEGLAAMLGGCSRQVDRMNRVGNPASVHAQFVASAVLAAAAAAAGECVGVLNRLEKM